MTAKVNRLGAFSGRFTVPGDKSISHRAAMIGALAEGTTEVRGYAPGEDCASMLACLKKLGAKFRKVAPGVLVITGKGREGLVEPGEVLNAGNSGTTMRLLSGVLASCPFYSVITGDSSLRGRPMDRVSLPLREMGATVLGRAAGRFAPLAISGGNLHGITWEPPVASAQVKSATLLAGLSASGTTTVIEPSITRDHTERMLEYFGAAVARDGVKVSVAGGARLTANTVEVPGDMSSAAFLLALGASIHGAEVVVLRVGVNPLRTGFLDALEKMSAEVQVEDRCLMGLEPVADVRVSGGELLPIELTAADVPAIVDEIPVLIVLATQAAGVTRITGAEELRVKESDRLAAMSAELRKMGARIEEQRDGVTVYGPTRLRGASVESRGDHRVAMALGVAGCLAEGTTSISEAECAGISYPGIWNVLEQVGRGRQDGGR